MTDDWEEVSQVVLFPMPLLASDRNYDSMKYDLLMTMIVMKEAYWRVWYSIIGDVWRTEETLLNVLKAIRNEGIINEDV